MTTVYNINKGSRIIGKSLKNNTGMSISGMNHYYNYIIFAIMLPLDLQIWEAEIIHNNISSIIIITTIFPLINSHSLHTTKNKRFPDKHSTIRFCHDSLQVSILEISYLFVVHNYISLHKENG